MDGVRIRWRGVARAAAIVAVAAVALRLLPGLVRAPEPPPLGADVGLPRTVRREAVQVERVPAPVTAKRAPRPRREKPKARRRAVVQDAPAATATIGSRARRRRPKAVESPPPRVPEYVPPPPPEPPPTPLPEPPPAPPSVPGDGSEEFTPH
ncbi:MAG: hypothetical protein JSU06_09300 [Actinobacteria bacterium]|nr:hypothetical protein [Actinomycetota bacterium]